MITYVANNTVSDETYHPLCYYLLPGHYLLFQSIKIIIGSALVSIFGPFLRGAISHLSVRNRD
jgi:hypothetical protein